MGLVSGGPAVAVVTKDAKSCCEPHLLNVSDIVIPGGARSSKQVCIMVDSKVLFELNLISSILVDGVNRVGCRPGFSRGKTSSCGLLIQVGFKEEVWDGQFN